MRRFFILLLSAYLLAIFQSAVTSEILPSFMKPDLMLILVTYLGVSPFLMAGAIGCGIVVFTQSLSRTAGASSAKTVRRLREF